jgi:signal transduction histidine kinase
VSLFDPNHSSPLLSAIESELPAMSWPERRDLVARAVSGLRAADESPASERLLFLLAQDTKWEVRKAVADHLLQLPELLYARSIAVLANDHNAYVKQAVERSMMRRSIQTTKEKRQPAPIKRIVADIESRFGQDGVKLAKKHSEKVTEQVIRTAVHDIKGILTPIKPYLDGLRETVANKTEKRHVERILESIEYLERMLADMRQWSEDIKLALAEEDLVAVLESAVRDSSDYLRAQGKDASQVQTDLVSKSRPRLLLSRPQIQMAFTNLIRNAIEAHAIDSRNFKPGSVRIMVTAESESVQVEIKDTGKGIETRDLEKLMEFVPGNTSKKHHGTGYGLPISKRYIEGHNGQLTITSAEDKGTTVLVSLPILPF